METSHAHKQYLLRPQRLELQLRVAILHDLNLPCFTKGSLDIVNFQPEPLGPKPEAEAVLTHCLRSTFEPQAAA